MKPARFIHAESAVADKPFVAVNCAGLSPDLLESEVFGHVKGAFTTAHRTHAGLVSAASGGTLFLDEVAELAPSTQAKLLRFIETGEFRKLGATQIEKSTARIIAASNVSLDLAVRQKKFREDLYFRLAVVSLGLPPLRARREDIAPLASYFLQTINGRENKSFTRIDNAALALLQARDWPGNIRALWNTLYSAIALHDAETLMPHMLETEISVQDNSLATLRPAARPQPLWRVQEKAIEAAIAYCDGNIPHAARLLEVSPSTLYRRRETVDVPVKSI